MLTAHAPILPLRWLVFVELPIDEAYAPLYDSIKRSSYLLLGGLALAFLAGLFLARKMIVPIQALREGAARIGAGDLDQRISIKTGDELEVLADQFNDMAGRLEESYAGLETEGRAAHARADRIAGAADGDLGGAPGHSAARRANSSRCSRPCWRTRRAFAKRAFGSMLLARGRWIPARRDCMTRRRGFAEFSAADRPFSRQMPRPSRRSA